MIPAPTEHPVGRHDAQPFIAADVGGTHARLGLVQVRPGGKVDVLAYHRYACGEFPSLAAIIDDFVTAHGADRTHAVVAIAGRLEGDTLINSNLQWPVSVERTRREARIAYLALLNDFEAVACAMPYIDVAAMTRVCGPLQAGEGPALVLGPGTGFGASLCLPRTLQQGVPLRVLASEAGHASLAAGNARELALIARLLERWPHVDNERVLSGPGLVNTYTALCEIDGATPRLDTPEAIVTAAQAGGDRHAQEALRMFCGLLGSLAGDLALTFGADAVYLAGGIPAQIRPFLLESDFAQRFRNKGVLGEVLARVPVWLVDHGQLGLVGAAAWYYERHSGF
ncbi:glucokinase [Lysobacter sp. FW306-1B-D06B]|uniref:glucokinase n=1 Tax=Lysobacter sp. FW306-1B-D06B TaxID=3140250 RepID=UPI0031408EFA